MCDAISRGLCSARKTFCMSAKKWLFLSGRPPLPLTAPSGMSDDGGKKQCPNLRLWHHSRHLCRRRTTLVCLRASVVCVTCSWWGSPATSREKKRIAAFSQTKTKQNKQTNELKLSQLCFKHPFICRVFQWKAEDPPPPPPPPPHSHHSLSGRAGSAHRARYFSTQWRNGVVFTSRSEILCGALEECLASHLVHWPHSGWMMSHAQKKTYIWDDIIHTRPTEVLV